MQLRENSLEKLNFEGWRWNELGEERLYVIANDVKKSSCVNEILFRECKMGPKGCGTLCEALKVSQSITVIDLSLNNLGPEGARLIGEALKVNRSVKRFFLESNHLGPKGAGAIGEALKVNQTVTTLRIGFNSVGEEGTRAFEEALERNGSVVDIDIDSNTTLMKYYCFRNKVMHKRARECVVCLLALRRRMSQEIARMPKEMVQMLGMFLWETRTDVEGWCRQ